MEQMIQALLGPQWGEWKSQLATHLSISEEQAGTTLAGSAQQVMGLFTQGQLDLAKLQTPQGVSDLLGRLDMQSLAKQAGVDSARLEGGLGDVLPGLVQKAGAILGGGTGLSDILGGIQPDRS